MNDPFEKNEQIENRNAFSPIDGEDYQPPKHSGMGIASFVLSLVGIVSFVILTIAIASLFVEAIDVNQIVDDYGNRLMSDEEIADKIQPFIGYLILYPLLLLVVLVGLILGIIALTRPGTKKVFAVLGTVFNGLPLLFTVLLFLIGLANI